MPVTILDKLGSGNFGTVYKARKEDGEIFAIKVIPANKLKYIETDILTRLRSPYLIRSINPLINEIKDEKGLSFELKENHIGELFVDKLSFMQIRRIIISCLYGLQCMHKNGFIHTDLSIENILYDNDETGDLTAFIGDFGCAVRSSDPETGVMTECFIKKVYTPPEILDSVINNDKYKNYNSKTDIWSLGIVFLLLLGARLTFTNTDQLKEKINSINEEYIEEKIRTYNYNKMSSKEELELKELLVNMLKINPEERISTTDIKKLAFMKHTVLDERCVLEKPREVVYIPYVTPGTIKGLTKIKNIFLNYEEDRNLEEYFLTLQNYSRMVSKSKPDLTEKELDKIIEVSLNITNNYYRHKNKETKKSSYEIIEKLDGETGYNPYFYKAQYLEDLLLLNYYVTNNENIFSFYNLINPCDIFIEFRKLYKYNYNSKHNYKVKDFFKASLPVENNTTEIVVFKPNDYHNKIREIKTDNSSIKLIKLIEEDLRSELIEKIKDKLEENKETIDGEKVTMLYSIASARDGSMRYKNLTETLKNNTLSESLRNSIPSLKYGLIKTNINNEIIIEEDIERKYVILLTYRKASLLNIDKSNKKVIHYYGDKNKKICDFYQEKGYTYENNFNFGIGNCCKLLETCIIFNIYFNIKENKEDFSTKCLEKNTIFAMLFYLLVFHNGL